MNKRIRANIFFVHPGRFKPRNEVMDYEEYELWSITLQGKELLADES